MWRSVGGHLGVIWGSFGGHLGVSEVICDHLGVKKGSRTGHLGVELMLGGSLWGQWGGQEGVICHFWVRGGHVMVMRGREGIIWVIRGSFGVKKGSVGSPGVIWWRYLVMSLKKFVIVDLAMHNCAWSKSTFGLNPQLCTTSAHLCTIKCLDVSPAQYSIHWATESDIKMWKL